MAVDKRLLIVAYITVLNGCISTPTERTVPVCENLNPIWMPEFQIEPKNYRLEISTGSISLGFLVNEDGSTSQAQLLKSEIRPVPDELDEQAVLWMESVVFPPVPYRCSGIFEIRINLAIPDSAEEI